MKTLLARFASLFILLFPLNINFAQAPDLGIASSFVVFTAVGAFNNTGTTTDVTGDVGTNVGAFNAFPPGTLTGQQHVADATSAEAATDVEDAYLQLSATTCGLAIGVTLGRGQVLMAGVYCTEAASTLDGNLTFDGQGNPDAVFIIKIGGAFATSTFSNVYLINSADACNVYWQINGRFDLGDGSAFQGTAVVNGAIELLGNSSLFGRALSRAGAISLHENTIALSESLPLPITLVAFNAECETTSSVKLNWQTATELNSAYFNIERSTNGINFKTIGTHPAAGSSTQLLSYFFTDQNIEQGINYYRLNQFDFNNVHSYSAIKAIRCSGAILPLNIYPNPFSNSLNIIINNDVQINNSTLSIFNVWGVKVINTILFRRVTTLNTSDIPSGIYFYKIIGNHETIQSGRLIAVH